MVRQWCCEFNEGCTNVFDEKKSGRPSVQKDDLIEQVNNKNLRRLYH